jgi:hypothetical protein
VLRDQTGRHLAACHLPHRGCHGFAIMQQERYALVSSEAWTGRCIDSHLSTLHDHSKNVRLLQQVVYTAWKNILILPPATVERQYMCSLRCSNMRTSRECPCLQHSKPWCTHLRRCPAYPGCNALDNPAQVRWQRPAHQTNRATLPPNMHSRYTAVTADKQLTVHKQ